jgi:glutamate formiminotransferase/formiminotetrahydrofolate cyclodeaminase
MKLIECVPNFSDGRNPDVINAIRDAIAAIPTVAILDVSSDASHHRTVMTFVVDAAHAVDAAYVGIAVAAVRIDLTSHQGEHPRLGATDVCPFIPLEGATMEDCIALARALGERVGRDLQIPVFLYERAATRPDRENLADIRRGEFEGMRTDIGTTPARTPDFGPSTVHPTAGALVTGARPFLVAYNVYLGPATNLAIAKDVAKAVRGSSGGLRFVKGLGLEVDGQAQVSMNLVDTQRTPLYRAYDMVRMEAEARGVTPTWSELVGLVPERVLFETAARHIRLPNFSTEMVLEHKVRKAVSGGESLSGFVASVASPAPVPGGGSVSAHAGALAAALAQMVAGLTIGKKKYVNVEAEMKDIGQRAAALGTRLGSLVQRDADAYAAVSAAYKMPQDTDTQKAERDAAIQSALVFASEIPLETAEACADAAELAAAIAARGNTNAVSDAGVAALMAEAGSRGAAYNVRINVASLTDAATAQRLAAAAQRAVTRASTAATAATAAVDAAIGAPI